MKDWVRGAGYIPIARGGLCEDEAEDPFGTRPLEHPGAGVQGRPRGGHVVHQNHAATANRLLVDKPKGPPQVLSSLSTFESCLGPRVSCSPQNQVVLIRPQHLGDVFREEEALIETPFPQSFRVERNGDDEWGRQILEPVGCENGEQGTKNPGQMAFTVVFELLKGGHDGALIMVGTSCLVKKGAFPQTVFADAIMPCPGSKGPTADRTPGRFDRNKVPEAGTTEEKVFSVDPNPFITEEGLADGTSRGIDEIDELGEKAHFESSVACLTNSSWEQSGLIPGQASWACFQVSRSLRRAG